MGCARVSLLSFFLSRHFGTRDIYTRFAWRYWSSFSDPKVFVREAGELILCLFDSIRLIFWYTCFFFTYLSTYY